MRSAQAIFLAVAVGVGLTACGASGSAGGPTAEASVPASARTTTSGTPTAKQLDQAQLDAAIIGLNDVPPGWSIQAATTSASTSSTAPTTAKAGCDAKDIGLKATAKAERQLQKGGGLSTMAASLLVAQFAGADDAKQAMSFVRDKFPTCIADTTMTPVAPPKVGDEAAAWRMSAKGVSGTVDVARSGPLLVLTVGGGLMDVPAADLETMLKAQIDKYRAAVKS